MYRSERSQCSDELKHSSTLHVRIQLPRLVEGSAQH